MTCYGAVQVNKYNLLCFVVKNSAVTKIKKIHFIQCYTGLVMFYFRCRKDVATLQPVTTCELVHDIE